jgi:hypothetical protein
MKQDIAKARGNLTKALGSTRAVVEVQLDKCQHRTELVGCTYVWDRRTGKFASHRFLAPTLRARELLPQSISCHKRVSVKRNDDVRDILAQRERIDPQAMVLEEAAVEYQSRHRWVGHPAHPRSWSKACKTVVEAGKCFVFVWDPCYAMQSETAKRPEFLRVCRVASLTP